MKNNLLFIPLLISAHFAFAQNVKIIPASSRSTSTTSTAVIPAPAHPTITHTATDAGKKTDPAATQKSSGQKKEDVKSVHGGCQKKSCVKKVDSSEKNSSTPQKGKPVESAKK